MDLEYDAFDEGIEPGGCAAGMRLRCSSAICSRALNSPSPSSLSMRYCKRTAWTNYFEINQAVSDLVRAGSLEEAAQEGDTVYRVTDQGRSAAQTLEVNLPRSVREKAVNAAIRLLTRAKREQENRN